jgi:hypothetical protein
VISARECREYGASHFHLTNSGVRILSSVGLVQPTRHSGIAFRDFDLANAQHRKQMWIGRVELLFTASFKNAQGEAFEFDLALLSCLYYFEHLSAMGPLQAEAGASGRLCCPSIIFCAGYRSCCFFWQPEDQMCQPPPILSRGTRPDNFSTDALISRGVKMSESQTDPAAVCSSSMCICGSLFSFAVNMKRILSKQHLFPIKFMKSFSTLKTLDS